MDYETLTLKTSKNILSGALPNTCIINPCQGHSAPWGTMNFRITMSQRMRQNTKGECFRYPALKFKSKLYLSLVFQTDFHYVAQAVLEVIFLPQKRKQLTSQPE